MTSSSGTKGRKDTDEMLSSLRGVDASRIELAALAEPTLYNGMKRPAESHDARAVDLEGSSVARASIVAENLSEAWLKAFELLMRPGVDSIEPLVVTVTGFDPSGRPIVTRAVSDLIDAELHADHEAQARKKGVGKHGPLTVRTVASTLFPDSLWNPAADRRGLYAKYNKMLPRLTRDRRNSRGTYFGRLIAYGRGPEGGNQLEHMIRTFAAGIRRTSAYQATVTDPATDMTATPLLGFPCLQQIAVHPSERTGTLAITGFYGTQYMFERGYGNFVGLCGLGRFLAHEMGLRLTRMTCVASYAVTGEMGKARGRALVAAAKRSVLAQSAAAPSHFDAHTPVPSSGAASQNDV